MIDKLTDKNKYSDKGLAEIVLSPSQCAVSFFQHWFNTSSSYARALTFLRIPYVATSEPLIELVDAQLKTNLLAEQDALYNNTLFYYKNDQTQSIDLTKVWQFSKVKNTFTSLVTQLSWVLKPAEITQLLRNEVEKLPETDNVKWVTFRDIDAFLTHEAIPVLISVAIVNEYYMQLVETAYKKDNQYQQIISYISSQVAKEDWLYHATQAAAEVQKDSLSIEDYLKIYGIRSDKDFDIAEPRWHEIPDQILKRVKAQKSVTAQKQDAPKPTSFENLRYVTSVIQLQKLRNDVRRKVLVYLDILRKQALKLVSAQQLPNCTRAQLLNPINIQATVQDKTVQKAHKTTQTSKQGTGRGVSAGKVEGKVLIIGNAAQDIKPKTIGIFPSAGTEFSFLYPQCSGIIFLKGGISSHGAIVAREYKIPAIIEPKATGLMTGDEVAIDGNTGIWKSTVPTLK